MNKEKYEELMLRFAKELHDVGVTDSVIGQTKDQLERVPNAVSVVKDEVTDRFVYRHDGYMIEATRAINLVVKKVS